MSYTVPNIQPSNITFAQLKAGGVSGHLELLIAAQPTMASPNAAPSAAPTLSQSGSGGTLPAGTYYVCVTEQNGIGETTASPVSAAQAITLGEDLVVTFAALKTGNTARNTYVGTASTGPFVLAASGTTASTLTISAPLPTSSYAVQPPTSNTTGLSSKKIELLRACKNGNLQVVYKFWSAVVSNFCAGEPSAFNSEITKLHDFHVVAAMLNTMASEQGALIDANPGTLGLAATGIGGIRPVRTWP